MTATPENAGTGTAATPLQDAEFATVPALQAALSAEHAAVYAYGYIGARSDGAQRERCYAHLDAHRGQRDTLRIELRDRGATPDPGKAAYDLPGGDSGADLAAYARSVEQQTAQSYLELAAAPGTAVRELALRSLRDATLRAVEWGAELPAFPGFPDEGPPPQAGG
ncbi:ferritin-like domain-containing protein [Streptomonospora litoralis]|uniref:DUF4439 domain-containing protein n=1 Tax=Streptomonospora litoralis TaxID=2498135 RepID=A0A4V0ZK33_9ACTN|nr:ferritin-like domain-containing protein [Streptomonospora litoralis]QBI55582.1 hypothetical protein EKD16_19095 [Streptomonospora litoralis]